MYAHFCQLSLCLFTPEETLPDYVIAACIKVRMPNGKYRDPWVTRNGPILTYQNKLYEFSCQCKQHKFSFDIKNWLNYGQFSALWKNIFTDHAASDRVYKIACPHGVFKALDDDND